MIFCDIKRRGNQMSLIINSTSGVTCPICLEDFKDSEPQVTHEGGEKHESFHPACLRGWVVRKATCPIDQQLLNPADFVSRVDQSKADLAWSVEHSAAICIGLGCAILFSACIITVVGGVMTLSKSDEKILILGKAILISGVIVGGIGALAMTIGGVKRDFCNDTYRRAAHEIDNSLELT
jgi:hypothetical protein